MFPFVLADSSTTIISAVSSLVSTMVVVTLAVQATLLKRKTAQEYDRRKYIDTAIDQRLAAIARTQAVVATSVATVSHKIDTNTDLTNDVHKEVISANGITGTELLERQEGRRIMEIDAADRTKSEQGYVDRLDAGGRDL